MSFFSRAVWMCGLPLCLAGCFRVVGPCVPGVLHDEVVVAPGIAIKSGPLASALLDRTGTFVHAVCGTARGRAFAADCIMKSDGSRFVAVFVSPGGSRIATLAYTRENGVEWKCDSRAVPHTLSPAYLLFDLAAANLSADGLAAALGDGFRVSADSGATRIALADGRPFAEVVRMENGDVRYAHALYGYAYTIRPHGQNSR